MQIIETNKIKVCQDCLMFLANGDAPENMDPAEFAERIAL